jgi:hypothetical protein
VRCCKIVLVRLLSSALLLPAVCVLLPSNVKRDLFKCLHYSDWNNLARDGRMP